MRFADAAARAGRGGRADATVREWRAPRTAAAGSRQARSSGASRAAFTVVARSFIAAVAAPGHRRRDAGARRARAVHPEVQAAPARPAALLDLAERDLEAPGRRGGRDRGGRGGRRRRRGGPARGGGGRGAERDPVAPPVGRASASSSSEPLPTADRVPVERDGRRRALVARCRPRRRAGRVGRARTGSGARRRPRTCPSPTRANAPSLPANTGPAVASVTSETESWSTPESGPAGGAPLSVAPLGERRERAGGVARVADRDLAGRRARPARGRRRGGSRCPSWSLATSGPVACAVTASARDVALGQQRERGRSPPRRPCRARASRSRSVRRRWSRARAHQKSPHRGRLGVRVRVREGVARAGRSGRPSASRSASRCSRRSRAASRGCRWTRATIENDLPSATRVIVALNVTVPVT